MAKPRKLWATSYTANPDTKVRHESELAAYRYVRSEAANWTCRGETDQKRYQVLSVWLDERDGRGWQLYEHVNLRDLP